MDVIAESLANAACKGFVRCAAIANNRSMEPIQGNLIRARAFVACCATIFSIALTPASHGAEASVSAWDAAEFRIWGFVPYWTPQSQLNSFPSDGVYDHVSDVLYFGGVRPTMGGGLNYHPNGAQHLATLKSHAAANDFDLHMSMFDTFGGSVDDVWNSIVGNAANRANFVSNVVNLLDANDMVGFNLDWERPSTDLEWAGYTQLAKDLKAALGPDREVSVDDYGFADSDWDNTPVFDARTYDQLFIMGYHYPADDGTSLDFETFVATKLNLTDQGVEKAFKDEQLVLGIGTWGASGPATVSLKSIVAVQPNLPADATTFTGTVADINGTLRTGTWTIESRYMVREKVQMALDRNMPGVMSWTLHHDATNKMSLHRVAHHYAMFHREIPDLDLDGVVDAADANALADQMGTVPGWTGTNTAARFENYYMSGNWELGDHEGNGFVSQADADWLAARFAALDVALPDRLAYTGTFETFSDGLGLVGRWQAERDDSLNLIKTGNFKQHAPGFLAFAATGIGGDKHSQAVVTIRNQNAAERFDSINTAPRTLGVELAEPIDLSTEDVRYFTFLVRENSAPLLSEHQTSSNRELSLQFLNAAGDNQFDIALHGLQQTLSIRSQADASGDDVSTSGFASDATFLVVGKISGNGSSANTVQASLFPSGSTIGNYAADEFEWMLTAESSSGFNPTVTDLQIQSLYEANYTVSNVWFATAAEFFALPSAASGDFNGDGVVNLADYTVWRDTIGQQDALLPADGDGNGAIDTRDYAIWKSNFGATLPAAFENPSALLAVPEPTAILVAVSLSVGGLLARRTQR